MDMRRVRYHMTPRITLVTTASNMLTTSNSGFACFPSVEITDPATIDITITPRKFVLLL